MQRLQKTLCAGGILGLCLSLATPAQAQVIYVQSSNLHAVPVAQSFVQTRTIVPRYSYGTSYSYGSNYGYGSNFGYGSAGVAWNNRTSGPAKWSQTTYLPESSALGAGVTNESYVVSHPVVSSGIVSARSYVAAQPRFVTQPVTTYRTVVASQPVIVSQPVAATRTIVLSQPVIQSVPVMVTQPSVRVFRSAAPAPQAATAETNRKTTQLEASDAKVSISETSDGRRVKVYRYEYELDHRPGRVTIEFDAKD